MADIYGLIPDVDSRGIPNQIAKFRQWNPDPVGGEAANLSKINPDLARVIAQTRADNPNLRFVLGSGARTAQQQDLAKSWGWSPVGAKGGGDAAIHMRGNAADLWPLNDQGQINFDPGQQQAVTAAMKAAADKLGVNLTAGGDWKHPDAPHFELTGNPNWTPSRQAGASSATTPSQPTPGTTLNSSSVIDTLSRNIAGIESPGWKNPYEALNPTTHAIGKYQVLPANVPGWTMAALGHSMTPEEFKASPAAQEAVFRDQMQRNLQLYSPKDAASIWFTGKPYNVAGGSVKDAVGTTNANYVARATAGLDNSGTFTPGAAVAAASGQPSGASGSPAGGSPAPAAPGQPAPPQQALAGFQAGSPAEKSMLAAGKTLGLGGQGPGGGGGLGGGGGDEPPPFHLQPVAPAQAMGGSMMIGPGGQNTLGQRAAQQYMAQLGQAYGFATAPSLAYGGANQAQSGLHSTIQPMAPAQATGLPGLPGTTLNSPSQAYTALMYGSLDPNDPYGRFSGASGS